MVNNSGSVIFSACWFIFSLEPRVPWKRHFRSQASGRGRPNRHRARAWVHPGGQSSQRFKLPGAAARKGKGAGRVRDTACLFSSRGKVPEVTCLHRGGVPQAVCPSQTGKRKGPREEGYRNSSAVSHSPRVRSSSLCVLSIATGPRPWGGLLTTNMATMKG